LFNQLTGARVKVANYPGVTVERRTGTCKLPDGSPLRVLDLPGCYSLTARSPEEEVAHNAILGAYDGVKSDLVVVVADASNLTRNLYLTMQLLEYGQPTILALNMMDVAKERGITLDTDALEKELNVPVIPLVATTGEGVNTLLMRMESLLLTPLVSERKPGLSNTDLTRIERILQLLREHKLQASWGHAIWLLTSKPAFAQALPSAVSTELSVEWDSLNTAPQDGPSLSFNRRVIVTRYAQIDALVEQCIRFEPPDTASSTERIDRVLLHPIWGLAIFTATMALVFQLVFTWADPLIGWVEGGLDLANNGLHSILSDGPIRDFLMDGLLAGVGNILVFLPQIVLLFLAIAILEDTGYMARAAFLIDSMMRKVGLHGKAFVPLLSSFACAIPGVMAARTIGSHKSRLVTILIAPLMSCSARLPVYVLVIGAVFATSEPILGVFSVGGLVITAMYFLGLFAALGLAFCLKRTLLREPPPPLVLELPSYKRPLVRSVMVNVFRRAKVFVTQTGPIILALSMILWALMQYPQTHMDPTTREARTIELSKTMSPETAEQIVRSEEDQLNLQYSIAGRAGQFIEPVIEPLGFDWKIGIGLIGSFAAREVLVSTLGQVYGVGSDVETDSIALRERLLADKDPETNAPRFTPLVGLSLMVFFVLAMQCLSTVAIVRRETNSWRWPLFMIVTMNGMAWSGSFITYQVGLLLGG
jgi:ferrous iron transport protein B